MQDVLIGSEFELLKAFNILTSSPPSLLPHPHIWLVHARAPRQHVKCHWDGTMPWHCMYSLRNKGVGPTSIRIDTTSARSREHPQANEKLHQCICSVILFLRPLRCFFGTKLESKCTSVTPHSPTNAPKNEKWLCHLKKSEVLLLHFLECKT